MDIGHTLGPVLDNLERVPRDADFVEPAVGEGEVRLDEFDPGAFAEGLADRGFDLTVHLPCEQPLVTSVPELDDALLTYLDRVLSVAADAGARKAVVHADARDPTDERQRNALREQVRGVDALSAEHGVEIVVENLGHLDRGFDLSLLTDVLADEGVSMCFDVGHAYLEVGQEAVESTLASYGDVVSHLHVHDVDVLDRPHVPVCGGVIDFCGVSDAIEPFDGTVAVEVFDGFGYAAESEERVRDAFG